MSEPIRKAEAYLPISQDVLDESAAFSTALLDALNNPGPPAPPKPPPPPPTGYQLLRQALLYDRVLDAVVELHEPVWDSTQDWQCRGCDADGYDWEPPRWPCTTIGLIAQELGVDLPAVTQ